MGGEPARDVGMLAPAKPPGACVCADDGRGPVVCMGVMPNAARTE
jgi:hypothetical protein